MIGMTKLDELNHKTDRQLIRLQESQIDDGVHAVLNALTAPNCPAQQASYAAARRAYEEALRLQSLLRETRAQEDSRLERLHRMLAILESPQAPSEQVIEDVAHTLWEVRGCPAGPPEEDWFRAEQTLRAIC